MFMNYMKDILETLCKAVRFVLVETSHPGNIGASATIAGATIGVSATIALLQ